MREKLNVHRHRKVESTVNLGSKEDAYDSDNYSDDWKELQLEEEAKQGLFTADPVNDYIFQSESSVRQWMAKRGMKKFINFTDEELNKLRQYFQDLDEDGSGKRA